MKFSRSIYGSLLTVFLSFITLYCAGQLTSQQLLQRGEDRALFTNDYAGAIADFTLVIHSNYNLAEAYSERGLAYSRETNYTQALLDFSNSIEADPKYWKAYTHRASTERKMGNISGCFSDLQTVTTLNTTNPLPLFAAGMMYEILTNWDNASDCYSRAIKLAPNDPMYYFCRGVSESARGNWRNALSDMNRFSQLDKNKPAWFDKKIDDEAKSDFYAYRGWIKLQLKQYISAVADARSAIYFYPSNGLAYYTLAWVKYCQNDVPRAVDDCKQALKYDQSSKDEKSRDQGLLSFVTGDYTNAITQWNLAIGLSRREYAAELLPWVARASELSTARTDGH